MSEYANIYLTKANMTTTLNSVQLHSRSIKSNREQHEQPNLPLVCSGVNSDGPRLVKTIVDQHLPPKPLLAD